MGREFSEMLTATMVSRMDSTYSTDAEITLEDAQSSVVAAELFLAEVRSILNY